MSESSFRKCLRGYGASAAVRADPSTRLRADAQPGRRRARRGDPSTRGDRVEC